MLTQEYALGRIGITFKDLALTDVRRALDDQGNPRTSGGPSAEREISRASAQLFQQIAKTGPVLIPIDFRRGYR